MFRDPTLYEVYWERARMQLKREECKHHDNRPMIESLSHTLYCRARSRETMPTQSRKVRD